MEELLFDTPTNAEITMTLVLVNAEPIVGLLSVFLIAIGAIRLAFVVRCLGRWFMLGGVMVFLVELLVYATFLTRTLGLTALSSAVLSFLPTIPFVLFAAGFLRLAWSLRRQERAA